MRKNLLLILVIILTFSCSTSIKTKEKLELSKNEKEIINNFLESVHEINLEMRIFNLWKLYMLAPNVIRWQKREG